LIGDDSIASPLATFFSAPTAGSEISSDTPRKKTTNNHVFEFFAVMPPFCHKGADEVTSTPGKRRIVDVESAQNHLSGNATYRELAEISLTFTQGRVLFVQLHALIAVKPDTQIGRFVVRKAKPKRLNVLAIRSQDN
jgi:hypothetical protein